MFIHGDVKPDNVMVEPTGRVQLIDWGDAGFADPAYDFQSLPMRSIETALRGYRSIRNDDPTLEARIIRRVLARSLSNLCRTPLTGPSWYRPIAANLTDLLTFAIDRRHTWDAWVNRDHPPATTEGQRTANEQDTATIDQRSWLRSSASNQPNHRPWACPIDARPAHIVEDRMSIPSLRRRASSSGRPTKTCSRRCRTRAVPIGLQTARGLGS